MWKNTRRMTGWLSFGLALCLTFSLGLKAQDAGKTPVQAPVRIDNSDTVILHGNVNPLARPEFNVGPTDPSTPMDNMILALRLSPQKKAALQAFLQAQQDPASSDYHHWLTPEAFGKRFGASDRDIRTVTGWLESQGFTIDKVSNGRTAINFSGTVAGVERAFHTQIDNYRVNGKVHDANAWDPSIPRALSGMVAGVVSLHNFPRKPMHSVVKRIPLNGVSPKFTYGSDHYLAPGDFATIYDLDPLYAEGTDGSGVTIAIVGRTHIPVDFVTAFRQQYNLPANDPVITVNPAGDPGDLGGGEDTEANLDVQWSGAVAPNATINFVCSASTRSTDGVDLSAQYIVDNDLAPIMSTSFGQCESIMGSAENQFYNDLWMQAAAEGITSFVSSGDNGSSGCDSASASTGSGLAVNGLSSTPYNVAVGGTQFMDTDNPSEYWSDNNDPADSSSALSYIPEQAWNESGNEDGGSGLWSTGGGASATYSKPSWQSAPGVPADGARDIPDVSLTAAGHDGYLVFSGGYIYIVSGTSASSPCFAGIMALVVQKTGERQGNVNPRLYALADAQYGGSGAPVFHDATTGDNSVPGVTGFYCGEGYDQATGLGSVDAYSLVDNWNSVTVCPDISVTPASFPDAGIGGTYSQSLSASGGAGPYTYSVTAGTLPDGLSLSPGGVLSGTPTTLADYTFTVTAEDANGCTGSQTCTLTVNNPPVISLVQKVGAPFRIKVMGSNLQAGIKVYINGSLWSNVKYKNETKIVIKKGKALKAVVPQGVQTEFRFVNPDGGEATKTFTW
jgi:subtilase family serine protease